MRGGAWSSKTLSPHWHQSFCPFFSHFLKETGVRSTSFSAYCRPYWICGTTTYWNLPSFVVFLMKFLSFSMKFPFLGTALYDGVFHSLLWRSRVFDFRKLYTGRFETYDFSLRAISFSLHWDRERSKSNKAKARKRKGKSLIESWFQLCLLFSDTTAPESPYRWNTRSWRIRLIVEPRSAIRMDSVVFMNNREFEYRKCGLRFGKTVKRRSSRNSNSSFPHFLSTRHASCQVTPTERGPLTDSFIHKSNPLNCETTGPTRDLLAVRNPTSTPDPTNRVLVPLSNMHRWNSHETFLHTMPAESTKKVSGGISRESVDNLSESRPSSARKFGNSSEKKIFYSLNPSSNHIFHSLR